MAGDFFSPPVIRVGRGRSEEVDELDVGSRSERDEGVGSGGWASSKKGEG